jgi:hypothetical protein
MLFNNDLAEFGVRALAIDPLTPSTLYAGTWGGVFRSTDASNTWMAVNNGLTSLGVLTVAIDPTNPSTLYAGTNGGGGFRTMDRGNHWTPINNGLTDNDVPALVIDPVTPSTLYGSTIAGVFRSTDGGENWTAVNAGLANQRLWVLAIDPVNPSTVYAGTANGVYRTTNGGESWNALNRGLEDLTITALAIDPGTPSTVYAGTENDGVFVYRPSLRNFFFPQFADGAAGTLQFQSTLILTNTGPDTTVRVELYRTGFGEPMVMTLGQLGTDSAFEFEMKKGESISLSTPGTGDIQVGYARIVAGSDVGGVVVFRRTDLTTGISLYEAGVPASSEQTESCLFVDSLGVRDTGFALVYPPEDRSSPAQKPVVNVTLRLYDKQFSLIGENTLEPLPTGSHFARFVHEMFDDPVVKAQAQEMEGILVIESDQPIVAVTVRQNDDPMKDFPQEVPILTTFPVMPGAPD